jgi:hypothetical protein
MRVAGLSGAVRPLCCDFQTARAPAVSERAPPDPIHRSCSHESQSTLSHMHAIPTTSCNVVFHRAVFACESATAEAPGWPHRRGCEMGSAPPEASGRKPVAVWPLMATRAGSMGGENMCGLDAGC